MSELTAQDAMRIESILREIVENGDSIAGADFSIGNEIKYCGFNPNNGTFVHCGWASDVLHAPYDCPSLDYNSHKPWPCESCRY